METDQMKETRKALNTRLFLLMTGLLLIFNAVTSNIGYGVNWIGLSTLVEDTIKEDAAGTGAEETEEAVEKTEEVSENAEAASEDAEAVSESAETPSEDAEAVSENAEAASENTEAAAEEFDVHELIRQMEENDISVSDLRMAGIAYLVAAIFEIVAGLLCALFANRVDRAKIVLSAAVALMVVEVCFVALLLINKMGALTTMFAALLFPGLLLWNAVKLWKMRKENPERVYVVPPSGKPTFGNGKKKAADIPKKSIHDRAMSVPVEEESYDEAGNPDGE